MSHMIVLFYNRFYTQPFQHFRRRVDQADTLRPRVDQADTLRPVVEQSDTLRPVVEEQLQ